MSSQKICYRCGGLNEQGVMASFDTDNCQFCLELDREEYSIQNKIYTREDVIEALKQGTIQGFDIAQNHHGERKPLHSFVVFLRFFLYI